MHYRYEYQCTVKSFECLEDIQNNAIYVVDPVLQKIRRAENPDEYFTERLVYVNNPQVFNPNLPMYGECNKVNENRIIPKGTMCRCWIVCMQMV